MTTHELKMLPRDFEQVFAFQAELIWFPTGWQVRDHVTLIERSDPSDCEVHHYLMGDGHCTCGGLSGRRVLVELVEVKHPVKPDALPYDPLGCRLFRIAVIGRQHA